MHRTKPLSHGRMEINKAVGSNESPGVKSNGIEERQKPSSSERTSETHSARRRKNRKSRHSRSKATKCSPTHQRFQKGASPGDESAGHCSDTSTSSVLDTETSIRSCRSRLGAEQNQTLPNRTTMSEGLQYPVYIKKMIGPEHSPAATLGSSLEDTDKSHTDYLSIGESFLVEYQRSDDSLDESSFSLGTEGSESVAQVTANTRTLSSIYDDHLSESCSAEESSRGGGSNDAGGRRRIARNHSSSVATVVSRSTKRGTGGSIRSVRSRARSSDPIKRNTSATSVDSQLLDERPSRSPVKRAQTMKPKRRFRRKENHDMTDSSLSEASSAYEIEESVPLSQVTSLLPSLDDDAPSASFSIEGVSQRRAGDEVARSVARTYSNEVATVVGRLKEKKTRTNPRRNHSESSVARRIRSKSKQPDRRNVSEEVSTTQVVGDSHSHNPLSRKKPREVKPHAHPTEKAKKPSSPRKTKQSHCHASGDVYKSPTKKVNMDVTPKLPSRSPQNMVVHVPVKGNPQTHNYTGEDQTLHTDKIKAAGFTNSIATKLIPGGWLQDKEEPPTASSSEIQELVPRQNNPPSLGSRLILRLKDKVSRKVPAAA